MMMDLLKNWKVLIWIVLVVASVILISPKFSTEGIQVTDVYKNSSIALAHGDIIYSINGNPATIDDLQKNYDGIVQLQTSKGSQFVNVNGTLGISGRHPPTTNLKFGLDIEGGVRTVLQLNQSDPAIVEQSISTIQTRINNFGLRETNIRSITEGGKAFIEITMAGGDIEEITKLVQTQGEFEAKIPLLINLQGGSGNFKLITNHAVTAGNGTLSIDDRDVKKGDMMIADGIPLSIDEFSAAKANITATVFTSEEIEFVYIDPQHSGVQPEGNGYSWSFQIRLSQQGADNFARVTQNLDIVYGTGKSMLSAPLMLYLDNELMDVLTIASELKGSSIREPSVTGYGETLEKAVTEERRLQAILRSGALPTSVEIAKMETISPLLGSAFLRNMMMAIIAAIIALSAVVAIRYRRIKVVIPIIITAFSEVLIILGMSVLIGWTLDLASMAAVIAILGTGMDAQIIMIDQAIKGKESMNLKERLKRAFFMIISSGGTVIAAMLPLLSIGLGVLRGFAITTIIGVLIGIIITRPAFNEMMRKMFG